MLFQLWLRGNNKKLLWRKSLYIQNRCYYKQCKIISISFTFHKAQPLFASVSILTQHMCFFVCFGNLFVTHVYAYHFNIYSEITGYVYDELPVQVRKHEPKLALDGGPDGLDFYRLWKNCKEKDQSNPLIDMVCENGLLILEVGAYQSESVIQLLSGKSFVLSDEIR